MELEAAKASEEEAQARIHSGVAPHKVPICCLCLSIVLTPYALLTYTYTYTHIRIHIRIHINTHTYTYTYASSPWASRLEFN